MESTSHRAKPCPAGLRTVLLLAALEPSLPRARIETALVLLGVRGAAVTEGAELGMLRVLGDSVDLVDGRVRKAVMTQATDRERRLAHLALAVARGGGTAGRAPDGWQSRSLFDRLAESVDQDQISDYSRAPMGMPGLTLREREIATIAATGLTNREIATRAAISPRTVEVYLTRIYRKLGVRCRAELAFAYGPR